MVIQSIVLYTALILFMVTLAKMFSLKQNYRVVNNIRVHQSKGGNLYLIAIIVLFSLMMGMRYGVGVDYFAYQEGYIYNYDVGKGEVLFMWIRELFNKFDFHYWVYFTFLALLNISFYLYGFKKEAFILPLLLFFLLTNGDWVFWMNGIRQAIAMCIWIYALQFIEARKKWSYFFWCIIAIGFHRSAIILIPLYFLLRNGKDYFSSIKLQLILVMGAFLAQYSFAPFLKLIEPLIQFFQTELSGGAYSYSVEKFEEQAASTVDGSGLAYLFKILLSIVVILYSKRLKAYYSSHWFNIVYFLFFIGFLAENMFPVGSGILTRPFRYFFIFKGVVFSYFVYYLLKSKFQNRKNLGFVIICFFIAMFYLSIITANTDSNLLFEFYFEQ